MQKLTKTRKDLAQYFRVALVEKAAVPEGAQGDNWYCYVLESGGSTIKGWRGGSLQEVTQYATRYAEELNARNNPSGKEAGKTNSDSLFTGGTRATSRAAKSVQHRVVPDEIQRRIAVAAYHRAEQRGFAPGYELADWLAAEREILVTRQSSP